MNRRELDPTALVSGLVFVVLGVLFLLERLGLLEVSSRFVLPVVLVGIGVGILLGTRRRPVAERHENEDTRPSE